MVGFSAPLKNVNVWHTKEFLKNDKTVIQYIMDG